MVFLAIEISLMFGTCPTDLHIIRTTAVRDINVLS